MFELSQILDVLVNSNEIVRLSCMISIDKLRIMMKVDVVVDKHEIMREFHRNVHQVLMMKLYIIVVFRSC